MNALRTALLSALAASAAAQAPMSLGPFAGVPMALSVDPATLSAGVPLDPTQVLEKGVGYIGAAPTAATPPATRPDFRDPLLWRNPGWGIAQPGLLPDVDALSIGLDLILSDRTGLMTVPIGDWGAITFSVTRTAAGAAPPITTEVARPDGASGDLFAYFLPNLVLPPAYSDATVRAIDSPEISIASPGTLGEMDAHDLYIPLYRMGPAVAATLGGGGTALQLFFSVTTATIGRVPAAWWAATAPSGGTVFTTTWNGTTWTMPTPFRTYAQLGLAVGDELDAVAVDLRRQQLLFSTKNAGAAWDEIMYFDLLGAGAPAIYRASNVAGDTVSRRAKLLRTDDVDAISALDPGLATPSQHDRFGACSYLRQPALPFPTVLTASAFRLRQVQQDALHVHVSGWPPRTGPGPGFAVLFLADPARPFDLVPVTVRSRNPASPFEGGPEEAILPVPPDPQLWSLPVLLYWAAVDGTFTDLATTYPVRVWL